MSMNDESNNPVDRLQQLHAMLQQAVGIKAKVNEAIDEIVTTVVIHLHPDVPELAREAICNRFAKQHPHATIATTEDVGKRKVDTAKLFLYDNDGDLIRTKKLNIAAFLVRAQRESTRPLAAMKFCFYKVSDVSPSVAAQSMFKEVMNRPGTDKSAEDNLRDLLADLDIPFDFGATSED